MESLATRPVKGILVNNEEAKNIFTGEVVLKVNNAQDKDENIFLGVCHLIHHCLKNKIRPVIYTTSYKTFNWVRNEKTDSQNERVLKAIQFLRSVPLKDTLLIEFWDEKVWN